MGGYIWAAGWEGSDQRILLTMGARKLYIFAGNRRTQQYRGVATLGR